MLRFSWAEQSEMTHAAFSQVGVNHRSRDVRAPIDVKCLSQCDERHPASIEIWSARIYHWMSWREWTRAAISSISGFIWAMWSCSVATAIPSVSQTTVMSLRGMGRTVTQGPNSFVRADFQVASGVCVGMAARTR